MKSIRDFIEGKIRRTESADRMRVDDGAPDAILGANQGVVTGPKGTITFYDEGLMIAADRVEYKDIEVVTIEASSADDCQVDIITAGGTTRLASSTIGGEIVHATLRWIGNTHLRRKIAD